ncbi:DEAD/DEAH box helicase [Trichococcus pasteurii]|uniref:Dead/deah box helicase n=1 Tax=Trichococcus pasteurii TaxID=43064 RepID=A0A1W1IIS1_9LACT|nr:DEAD/DEAH box helicase [Trichococcus pasteurii]SFE84267.1 competence protein ComFA [Trichococcus pasteurii]SLM52974.1 dead/deah box helicase [Trichococcus pasteurii]SSB93855.1 dead/deah box helicase [Trichococcus pasteurii]
MDGKELYGRELTRSECRSADDRLLALVEKRPGLVSANGKLTCNRCGNQDRNKMQAAPCSCGTACFYCLSCLNMGKIKSCTVLHHLPETNAFAWPHEPVLQWQGQLSSEQKRASDEIVETVRSEETRLIWAVAGAGKTEMIFEGIAACLRKGGRVCLASPRVDVCLELAPRIKQAFPDIPLALLYGGNEEGYSYTPLVIATTHQLLRFREAFDLLVIDEIDSFPFHNDASLQFGAQKSRKKTSALIYLTATPSRAMQNDIKRGRLAATVLPARYHGFALPEPECLWVGNWRKAINRKKNARFLSLIRRQLQQQRRFLLFLPHIQLMEELDGWLRELFPDKQFTCVSASDPDREEKVKRMRAEMYDFLMTTTILERGVTFRDIDVIVLGAEDRVFTEASLVQIAGRAGRHKDFPTGRVCFAHDGETKAIQGAVRQIHSMNRAAGRRGLLNGSVSVLPK